jgi:hypothetical protein
MLFRFRGFDELIKGNNIIHTKLSFMSLSCFVINDLYQYKTKYYNANNFYMYIKQKLQIVFKEKL